MTDKELLLATIARGVEIKASGMPQEVGELLIIEFEDFKNKFFGDIPEGAAKGALLVMTESLIKFMMKTMDKKPIYKNGVH